MRLPLGTRLPHDFTSASTGANTDADRNRSIYRVTEVVSETPWSCLYRGMKVFRNFNFAQRKSIEVDDDECLQVLIKTLMYQVLDDRDYVRARRDHAWFEAKKILGLRETNVIPEPLDFLEVRNDQDAFSFPRSGQMAAAEPVIVFEQVFGQNLASWRREREPDLLSVFHVAGQILDLIETLHSRSMLLNVVSPASFWIDELQRIQFIGTENVIDESKAEKWRTLFPPERYANGFAPKELFEPDGIPSRESDIYGWAGLVYFLATGDSPARIASTQQHRWACFGKEHWDILRGNLVRLGPGRITEIRESLNIDSPRFERNWPESFIYGLVSSLDSDRSLRPTTVDALRNWWVKVPPTPVQTCVGLVGSDGRARLTFLPGHLHGPVEFLLARQLGTPPRAISDGVTVWRGRSVARIEDTLPLPTGSHARSAGAPDWQYSVFVIDAADGNESVSHATAALLLDKAPPEFPRVLAERFALRPTGASTVSGRRPVPPELELLSQLESYSAVADNLLDSRVEDVRAWAIALLKRKLSEEPIDVRCRALLFDRGLRDESYELRMAAAAAFAGSHSPLNPDFVVKLAVALGGDKIDDRIRAAKALRSVGFDERLVAGAVKALELDRELECPACGARMRAGDLDSHLISQHGYMPVDGEILPFDGAQIRLWERVLTKFDVRSFAELIGAVSERLGAGAERKLSEDFTSFFRQTYKLLPRDANNGESDSLNALAECLASEKRFRHVCRPLLAHDDARLRDIARRVFLPGIAKNLAAESVDPADLRTAIDFLVPSGVIDERLAVCRSLTESGANMKAVLRCAHDLQLERRVSCPECGEILQKRAMPRHRRLEHGAYEFDGQLWTWEQLIPHLVEQAVASESNLFAAQTLVELLDEKYEAKAIDNLIVLLVPAIAGIDQSPNRDSILSSTASSFAPLSVAAPLAIALFKSESMGCADLGLLIFAHARDIPPVHIWHSVVVQISRSDRSLEARTQAAARFLKLQGVTSDVAIGALRALAQGIQDHFGAIQVLQGMESRFGQFPQIAAVCEEIESSRRIRCPKCDLVLNGREMRDHCATAHKLIFDGKRARRPWAAALDCLDTYLADPNADVLARGEALAAMEDGDRSRMRFIREALRRQIDPGHYRQALKNSLADLDCTVCPNCFENVTSPGMAPVMRVTADAFGNIDSSLLSIRQTGGSPFWSAIDIAGKKARWTGPDSNWSVTRFGAVMLSLLFTWTPGLFLALTASDSGFALKIAGAGFLVGGFLALLAWMLYRPRWGNPMAVAWTIVVPHLLKLPIDQVTASFIAGLSRASSVRKRVGYRERPLEQTIDAFRDAVIANNLPYAYLAAMLQLKLAGLLERDKLLEVRQLIAEIFHDVLDGKVPLKCLDAVTKDGARLNQLEITDVIAVRWRLYSIAHDVGLSGRDLLTFCETSGTIQAILSPEPKATIRSISEAMAVFDLTPVDRRSTHATTAMELLENGDLEDFKDYPDLLLISKVDKIVLCSKGLIYRGQCFRSAPTIAQHSKKEFVQTGWTFERTDRGPDRRYKNNPPVGYERITSFELVIGNEIHEFRSDPKEIASMIERYSRLLFDAVKGRADTYSTAAPTYRPSKALELVKCPHCTRLLQYRKGRFASLAPSSE